MRFPNWLNDSDRKEGPLAITFSPLTLIRLTDAQRTEITSSRPHGGWQFSVKTDDFRKRTEQASSTFYGKAEGKEGRGGMIVFIITI